MGLFSSTTDNKDRERWEKLHPLVSNGLRNFKMLGASLKEIRDAQLYRFNYGTFEECCTLHWKISARHATRLIVAFETAEELGPMGLPDDVSERQLRPLTQLPVDQRRDAYVEASADGGTPAAIERAVAKRRKKTAKPSTLKRLRIRVPGGTVVLEPNRRATSHAELLQHATQMLAQQRDQKNAA